MYMTRCIFDAFKVDTLNPPYDTGIARIYYPGQFGDTATERNTGAVPVDPTLSPCPVLIILPGMNTDHSSYRWLAELLAPFGIATVTYQLISHGGIGGIVATPGIDAEALTPAQFGDRPSAIAMPAIMSMLERVNAEGTLAGKLDLQRLAFGGHSAGGTASLLNARTSWFPGLKAVFSYGAHSGASTALGWPAQTVLPIGGDVPVLLIGGEQDGCIAQSAHHYGSSNASSTDRLRQTFDEALPDRDGSNTLLLLKDANHFSICSPPDSTCGRGFIDSPVTPERARHVIGQAISLFLRSHLTDDEDARQAYRELDGIDRMATSTLFRK
ncbi:alpha/beta hydrolase family protein [Microbulbifer aggregans]|uniref:alpha/beta hydrolase family protein n=1 Tax=Microbulbifer aggregans TaxID=1769779 RepID=UPI001CFF5355|nr:hypothetical protein [Microbulbifer aggregans]